MAVQQYIRPLGFLNEPWSQGFIPSPAMHFYRALYLALPQLAVPRRTLFSQSLAISATEEDNKEIQHIAHSVQYIPHSDTPCIRNRLSFFVEVSSLFQYTGVGGRVGVVTTTHAAGIGH